jgi:hypothetical protein
MLSVFTNKIVIAESNYIADNYWAQLSVIFLFSFATFMLQNEKSIGRATFGSVVVVYLFYIFTAPPIKAPRPASLSRVLTKKTLHDKTLLPGYYSF